MVFDCNVYLDIARLLGPPFTWERFVERAELGAVPGYRSDGLDSAIALGYTRSGTFVTGQPLTVWSSHYIEQAVTVMAQASKTSEYPGLELTEAESDSLFHEVIDHLVPAKQVVDVDTPDGPGALSRDDGLVFATAVNAGHHLNHKYLITKDKGFRELGDPTGRVTVLYPHQFIGLLRDSRRLAAGGGPRPRW